MVTSKHTSSEEQFFNSDFSASNENDAWDKHLRNENQREIRSRSERVFVSQRSVDANDTDWFRVPAKNAKEDYEKDIVIAKT